MNKDIYLDMPSGARRGLATNTTLTHMLNFKLKWDGDELLTMSGGNLVGTRHPQQRNGIVVEETSMTREERQIFECTLALSSARGEVLKADSEAPQGARDARETASWFEGLVRREIGGLWQLSERLMWRQDGRHAPDMTGLDDAWKSGHRGETSAVLNELAFKRLRLARRAATWTALREWTERHGLDAPLSCTVRNHSALLSPEDADAEWSTQSALVVALKLGAIAWLQGEAGTPFEQAIRRTWSAHDLNLWRAASRGAIHVHAIIRLLDYAKEHGTLDLNSEITALEATPGYAPSTQRVRPAERIGRISRRDLFDEEEMGMDMMAMINMGHRRRRWKARGEQSGNEPEVSNELHLEWSADGLIIGGRPTQWPPTIQNAEWFIQRRHNCEDPHGPEAIPNTPLSRETVQALEATGLFSAEQLRGAGRQTLRTLCLDARLELKTHEAGGEDVTKTELKLMSLWIAAAEDETQLLNAARLITLAPGALWMAESLSHELLRPGPHSKKLKAALKGEPNRERLAMSSVWYQRRNFEERARVHGDGLQAQNLKTS